jgi:stress response protein YsnF
MSSGDASGRGDGAPLQRAAWIDGEAPAGEVRIGESRLVKGGARISSATEEAPPAEAGREARGRVLSEAEIAESGLLRERVIEIGEMREEAVVSKKAVVREELVVRRGVEQRTERIAETLRRTEVDVERLEPEEAARSDGAGDASDR